MSTKLTPRQIDKRLKIGADPEFLLMKAGGGAQNGNEIVRSGQYNAFGVDGAGTALEIRPTASADPRKVVKSIQRAMRWGLKHNPRTMEFEWKAGGDRSHPIGGHIHFGTNALNLEEDYEDTERNIADAMDRFLAVPVLSLEVKEMAAYRRSGTGYGNLSDIRDQDWGCEYRTLGSWITSPQVSLAVLSLAKVVAVETLSGLLRDKDLYVFSRTEFNKATLSPAITAKAWNRIEKMALYPKYKRAINVIRTLVKNGKTWDAGDLRSSWGLLSPRLIAKMKKENSPMLAEMLKLSAIWKGHKGSLYTVRLARL